MDSLNAAGTIFYIDGEPLEMGGCSVRSGTSEQRFTVWMASTRPEDIHCLHLIATCNLPCAASPPSALSLPQVVSMLYSTWNTFPKSNSTKPRAVPKFIVNLLEHLRPGLPMDQAAPPRPAQQGWEPPVGRDSASRAGMLPQGQVVWC